MGEEPVDLLLGCGDLARLWLARSRERLARACSGGLVDIAKDFSERDDAVVCCPRLMLLLPVDGQLGDERGGDAPFYAVERADERAGGVAEM